MFVVESRAQQPNDSHEPLGSGRPARDLANQLRSRLGQQPPPKLDPATAKRLGELFGNADPKTIKDRLGQDPETLSKFRQMMEQNPELKKLAEPYMKGERPDVSPENRERIGEILRNWQKNASTGSANGPAPAMPDVNGPSAMPAISPSDNTPGTATPAMPSKLPDVKTPKEERWQNLTKGLDRWVPKNSRNNPTMKRLFDKLAKSDFSKNANSRYKSGPRINWDRVGGRLKGSNWLFDRTLERIDGSRAGRAPRLNAPRIPDGPNLPSVSPSSGPSFGSFELGGAATVLLMLAAVALAGFLLWRYLLRPLRQQQFKKPGDELGPWPVDPANVRTRADLVKAFDYLALLRCGKPARVWHHREVANRLGSEDDHRHQSATALADVYERARYAPFQDDLAADQMDRARRELCFLAGVTAQ